MAFLTWHRYTITWKVGAAKIQTEKNRTRLRKSYIYICVRNSTEREAQNVGSKFVYVCQYAHSYVFSRPVDTKNSFGRFVCFNLAVEQNRKREETFFLSWILYFYIWACDSVLFRTNILSKIEGVQNHYSIRNQHHGIFLVG